MERPNFDLLSFMEEEDEMGDLIKLLKADVELLFKNDVNT